MVHPFPPPLLRLRGFCSRFGLSAEGFGEGRRQVTEIHEGVEGENLDILALRLDKFLHCLDGVPGVGEQLPVDRFRQLLANFYLPCL